MCTRTHTHTHTYIYIYIVKRYLVKAKVWPISLSRYLHVSIYEYMYIHLSV